MEFCYLQSYIISTINNWLKYNERIIRHRSIIFFFPLHLTFFALTELIIFFINISITTVENKFLWIPFFIRKAFKKINRIFHDIVQNSFATYPPYLIMTHLQVIMTNIYIKLHSGCFIFNIFNGIADEKALKIQIP